MEPKSMPKRIKNQCQNWYRKRSGKSSKIMFLWRVKSLKFIGKTMVSDSLEGCMCEWLRYQKNIKNETRIPLKFNEKSIQKICSKKREPKYENSSKQWSKNGAKIHQKSLQKSMRKKVRKKGGDPGKNLGPAECAGPAERQGEVQNLSGFGKILITNLNPKF